MTKAGFFGVVSFIIIFALLFTQSISFQQADFDGAYLLKRQHRSRYFEFYSTDQDRPTIQQLSSILETNIRLIRRNLRSESRESIVVEIYPDLTAFHEAIDYPEAPDWATGYAGNGRIQIVSPLNPGPRHSFDTTLRVALHEMTHVITARMATQRIPTWLNEGIALYESQTADNIHATLARDIEQDLIPSLTDLDVELDARDSVSTFVERHGYEYAYTLVEFIVNQYGYDGLIELLKSPLDYRAAFELTEDEFYEGWVGFLHQAYGPRSHVK
jgi:hypothetical protein